MTLPVIAVFDFDETLIKYDSLFDFVSRSSNPLVFLVKGVCFIPSFILFVLKRIPNQEAKERLLVLFFKGMSLKKFNTLCERYAKRLNAVVNPNAINKLLWHQRKGDEVIIVSASIENWIKPWAKQYNVEVISTKLEVKGNRLTGMINGKNCHGPEKVNRFLQKYPNRKKYILIAYGDGKSDQAIFQLADKYYTSFREV